MFPDGSVAFAVTLPAGIATVGVIVALPFSSAVASPILLPSLSNNSTLVPGSALTSTGVLVPALSVRSVATTGLAGAVVSVVATIGSLASEVFPDGSVAFAVTLPAGMLTVGTTTARPVSSAVASPILLPSLSNNSTLEPGSAITSIGVRVPALPVRSVFTTGASGAIVSVPLPTVTDVGLEVLPASSVAVTETVSPSFKPLTGTLKLPS